MLVFTFWLWLVFTGGGVTGFLLIGKQPPSSNVEKTKIVRSFFLSFFTYLIFFIALLVSDVLPVTYAAPPQPTGLDAEAYCDGNS